MVQFATSFVQIVYLICNFWVLPVYLLTTDISESTFDYLFYCMKKTPQKNSHTSLSLFVSLKALFVFNRKWYHGIPRWFIQANIIHRCSITANILHFIDFLPLFVWMFHTPSNDFINETTTKPDTETQNAFCFKKPCALEFTSVRKVITIKEIRVMCAQITPISFLLKTRVCSLLRIGRRSISVLFFCESPPFCSTWWK